MRPEFSIRVLDLNFAECDFTGCDLRKRIAYAICVLNSNFAYSTRFFVLDSNIYAIFGTKLGVICVRDLRTRFDFAYAICVRDSIF